MFFSRFISLIIIITFIPEDVLRLYGEHHNALIKNKLMFIAVNISLNYNEVFKAPSDEGNVTIVTEGESFAKQNRRKQIN